MGEGRRGGGGGRVGEGGGGRGGGERKRPRRRRGRRVGERGRRRMFAFLSVTNICTMDFSYIR